MASGADNDRGVRSSRGAGHTARGSEKFFGCYLVGSQNPAMKGRSYVGFTVNPPRRLRQHNGVLAAGARYTRRLRPCEMIVVVHGRGETRQRARQRHFFSRLTRTVQRAKHSLCITRTIVLGDIATVNRQPIVAVYSHTFTRVQALD